MSKPDYDDAIESCIGLAVATPIQPVPVGLAGGGGYRTHSAQGCESSLGVEAFGIASSRDQQGSRCV